MCILCVRIYMCVRVCGFAFCLFFGLFIDYALPSLRAVMRGTALFVSSFVVWSVVSSSQTTKKTRCLIILRPHPSIALSLSLSLSRYLYFSLARSLGLSCSARHTRFQSVISRCICCILLWWSFVFLPLSLARALFHSLSVSRSLFPRFMLPVLCVLL